MAELPRYQRTAFRQVLPADLASAQAWETLAATMDNFSSQAASVARTAIQKQASDAATKTANERYQQSQQDAQIARDLAAEKYAKSQSDSDKARLLAAEKYLASQLAAEKARKLAEDKYQKSQLDSETARILAAEKYAASQQRQKESDEITRVEKERTRNLRISTSYVNSMEAEVLKTFRDLSILHTDDHEAYMEAANAAASEWFKDETLDSVEGMRQLFTTMVNNKLAQYAEKPYENTISAEREVQKTVALDNLDAVIADAVFQAEDWVRKANEAVLDMETHPEEFEDQRELVENQYEVLEVKIDQLVLEHNLSAEEALALETELKTRFLSGVITAQLALDMNNDEGWDSIEEFYENPNKFIKNNPYIAAMFPEGFRITDTERDEIWKELLDYKDTVNKHDDYADTKAEEALEIEHNDNFSDTLISLAEQDPEDPLVLQDLQDMLDADKISNEQHDALVYALTSDKYASEDDEVVFDVLQMLFDPQSNDAEIYEAIVEAVGNGDINRTTAEGMLTKLRSGTLKALTNSFEFQQAMKMIRMGLTKDADRYTEGEANAVRYAQEELYKRIMEGERPLDIYNEIIDRYQKVLIEEGSITEPLVEEVVEEVVEEPVEVDLMKAGSTYQNSVYDVETGFNTYFLGTHGSFTTSNAIHTEIKIGEQLENGLLTETQGAELMKQLHDYMRALIGLLPVQPYFIPTEILDEAIYRD